MLKKLTIEFTKPKGQLALLGGLMRVIQGTPYSHVRLKWNRPNGSTVIYEASGTNVHYKGPYAERINPVEVVAAFEITLTMRQYALLERVSDHYAGVSYGTFQLLGILLAELLNLKNNPLSRGRKSQVCSELVGMILETVLEIPTNLNLDIAGPKDVYQFLERYSNGKPGILGRKD